MSPVRSTILVVDDEESMRYFLEKTLRREGYDVVSAKDGPEALEIAQRTAVDLVLADVRMPGMDGVALLRALRAFQPRVPVVLMTAYGTVQDALGAMKQGATDYVLKPFRVEQIRETVARSLGGAARAPTVRDVVPDEIVSAPPPPSQAPATVTPVTPGERSDAPVGSLAAFLRREAQTRGLPLPPDLATGDLGLREVTRLCETVYVDELLRATEGNVSRAAEIAGITRPNMHRKVVDLGLSADAYRRDA
jgi:DNA-binding NtrC family response regulator